MNKSVTLRENLENAKKEINRRNSQILSESIDAGNSILSHDGTGKLTNSLIIESAYSTMSSNDKRNLTLKNSEFEQFNIDSIKNNRFNINCFKVTNETLFTLDSQIELIDQTTESNKENLNLQNEDNIIINTNEIKTMRSMRRSEEMIVTNLTKYEENMIFSYFNVMKNIVNSFNNQNKKSKEIFLEISEQTYIDTQNSEKPEDSINNEFIQKQNNYFQKIIKIVFIFILLIMNYLLTSSDMFLIIYNFIILSNDTKRSIKSKDIKKMSLCSKRWYKNYNLRLAFASVIMIEECIYRFSSSLNVHFLVFLNIFPLKKLWNCFLVIYVLLITGPSGGLNYIVLKIIKYLNRFKLLLK